MFELWPSVRGAHGWAPQSYSPRTGLVYIPVMEGASMIGDAGLDLANLPPEFASGVILDPDLDLPGARRGFLKAWDPVAQKERWRVATPGNWPGGTLVTAGDLVFQGRIDGQFVAHDALTGKELWSFAADAPVIAPPISYRLNGKQYLTVITGNGAGVGGVFSTINSNFNVDYYLPRRVLTFSLYGKIRLPKRNSFTLRPRLDDIYFVPNATLTKQGAHAFGRCINCHGNNALAAGTAPDLRNSPAILDKKAFRAIVKNGALVSVGMPSFSDIDEYTLETIRHYLRARAKDM
jgi:quinohemoprotein ethanol dehydrogenase